MVILGGGYNICLGLSLESLEWIRSYFLGSVSHCSVQPIPVFLSPVFSVFRDSSQQRTIDPVSFRKKVRPGRAGFSRISPSCSLLNPGRCSLYAKHPPAGDWERDIIVSGEVFVERLFAAAGAVWSKHPRMS